MWNFWPELMTFSLLYSNISIRWPTREHDSPWTCIMRASVKHAPTMEKGAINTETLEITQENSS